MEQAKHKDRKALAAGDGAGRAQGRRLPKTVKAIRKGGRSKVAAAAAASHGRSRSALDTLRLFRRSFIFQTKEFFDNSTLHGVRYIAEEGRPFFERFMWFCFVAFGFIAAVVIIFSLWEKFQTNPTITGLDTDFHNQQVIFPTVLVCPTAPYDEDAVRREAFQTLAGYEQGSEAYEPFLRLLTQLSYENVREAAAMLSDMPSTVTLQTVNLREMAFRVAVRCNDTFATCRYKDEDIDCCEIFKPLYTEHGFCYAFNARYTNNWQSAQHGGVRAVRDGQEVGADVRAAAREQHLRALVQRDLRLGLPAAGDVGRRLEGRVPHLNEADVHDRGRAAAVDRAAQVHLPGGGEAAVLPGRVHLLRLHEGVPHLEELQALPVRAAVLRAGGAHRPGLHDRQLPVSERVHGEHHQHPQLPGLRARLPEHRLRHREVLEDHENGGGAAGGAGHDRVPDLADHPLQARGPVRLGGPAGLVRRHRRPVPRLQPAVRRRVPVLLHHARLLHAVQEPRRAGGAREGADDQRDEPPRARPEAGRPTVNRAGAARSLRRPVRQAAAAAAAGVREAHHQRLQVGPVSHRRRGLRGPAVEPPPSTAQSKPEEARSVPARARELREPREQVRGQADDSLRRRRLHLRRLPAVNRFVVQPVLSMWIRQLDHNQRHRRH